MDNWIKEKHKEYELAAGMAVFYSPVVYNSKVLFIGDNPGD